MQFFEITSRLWKRRCGLRSGGPQDDVEMAIVVVVDCFGGRGGNKMFSAMFSSFFVVMGSALDGPV